MSTLENPEGQESEPEGPEAAPEPEAAEPEAAAAEGDDAAGEAAGDGEAAGEESAAEAPLTPKQRKALARARRGPRRPSTPEEREAQRKAKVEARRRWRLNRRKRDRERRGEPGPARTEPKPRERTGSPKERLGTVVSDKADKTITVRIDVARRHRRYQKIVRTSTTLHAHDERNEAKVGDLVRVIESRPLSATKRWRLVEILERAK